MIWHLLVDCCLHNVLQECLFCRSADRVCYSYLIRKPDAAVEMALCVAPQRACMSDAAPELHNVSSMSAKSSTEASNKQCLMHPMWFMEF